MIERWERGWVERERGDVVKRERDREKGIGVGRDWKRGKEKEEDGG